MVSFLLLGWFISCWGFSYCIHISVDSEKEENKEITSPEDNWPNPGLYSYIALLRIPLSNVPKNDLCTGRRTIEQMLQCSLRLKLNLDRGKIDGGNWSCTKCRSAVGQKRWELENCKVVYERQVQEVQIRKIKFLPQLDMEIPGNLL